MTQKARPIFDISTGSWTQVPLYSKLNEATPSDSSKVASNPAVKGDTFEVKLKSLRLPICGDQGLTVRLRKTEAGSLPITITLLQGTKVIASREDEPGQSFADVDLALTPEQICRITDYTDLSVRVTAGRPEVGCCPALGLPALLTATLNNVVGCPHLDGVEVPVCWNGEVWEGSIIDDCEIELKIKLSCGPTNAFAFTASWSNTINCALAFGSSFPTTTCNPLLIHFSLSFQVPNACTCCASANVTLDVDFTA